MPIIGRTDKQIGVIYVMDTQLHKSTYMDLGTEFLE